MPKVAKPSGRPSTKAKPSKGDKVEVIQKKEVIYPQVSICGIPIPEKSLKVTMANAKDYLGWETESDYYNRIKEEYPKIEKAHCLFNDEFLLRDASSGLNRLSKGNKVRCSHNSRNRPFSESWARSLAYDILKGNWQFNMETIIISRTGDVLSGQHRLIALILACQEWAGPNSLHWQELWPEEPYILSLVATGSSDEQKVVNTLDNVRSRSLGDIIYTSPVFADITNSTTRKRASTVLQQAIEFLWKRIKVSREGGDVPRTQSILMEFCDQHKKIIDFVRYFLSLDEYNSLTADTGIPSLGGAAGACYLQASSSSDPDAYTSAQTPTEEYLSWDNETKAKRFWEEVAKSTVLFQPVRNAIAALSDPDTGDKPGFNEKLCCLAKAWALFVENMPIEAEDIQLRYEEDNSGRRVLVEWPTFGGIDGGEPNKRTKPESTGPDEDTEERRRLFESKVRENNERMKRNGPYAHEEGGED